MYHYKLLKCLAQYLHATAHWGIRFKRTKPLQLLDANYERGFFHNTKYDVPNEPEMEELFNADITTNKLIGFSDATHVNDCTSHKGKNNSSSRSSISQIISMSGITETNQFVSCNVSIE